MEDLLKDMGNRIRDERKNKGLTQDKLAELAHVTPQTISTAELGSKAMRPETMLGICDALQISADYLLRGTIVSEDMADFFQKTSVLTPNQYRLLLEIIDNFISAIQDKEV